MDLLELVAGSKVAGSILLARTIADDDAHTFGNRILSYTV